MPTSAELLNHAGRVFQAGDLAAAGRICRQALEIDPGCVEALYLLAITCDQSGDFAQAEICYKRTLEAHPDDAELHFRLAILLYNLSRPAEAAEHFRATARLRPDSPEAWNNLGNAQFLLWQTAQAVRCYRTAVGIRPNYPEACQNLGKVLRDAEQLPEGLFWYRESVRLRPDAPKYRMNLALALLETGSALEAEGHLREYLRLIPDAPAALGALIAHDLYAETDPGIDQLMRRLEDPLERPDKAFLHFTLGRLIDRAGRPEEAFTHFEEMSRIRRDLIRGTALEFKPAEHTRLVDSLIALFTPEWFELHRDSGADTGDPVFIVGMPRSGSSLVEQILSNHPDVAGAGELRDIPRMVERLPARLGSSVPYPQLVEHLDPATVKSLAGEYLVHVRELAGGARCVTDKMLLNFLHLGFNALLFPGARVIHCRRDPLDTCVSCFTQFFRGISFTLDLRELGGYYRDYERLMAHWREVRPLPILEVVYEELVADVEHGSRQLVEFCGLPWDDRCLRFYENPRVVRTVSKSQIRKPIYTTSIGRSRRYGARLAPLIEALSGV
jgi:tetratricopeptide (TPR) repeat protein